MDAVKCPQKTFLFPKKLWQLVNDTKIHAIIWNSLENGIIVREDLIESQVLSLDIFKATSFSSFVRQLHYYGFRKYKPCSRDKPKSFIHHYTHPNFIRCQPERLSLVKRLPRQHWYTAQAAVNTAAQPKFLQGYSTVGPPYFCNMPQMPAESYYVDPNPRLACHLIPANPNVFHLNHLVVTGFWDLQHNPVVPYYLNPCGLDQMGYTGSTNQVPASQPRAPASLFRMKTPSPSTSVSQTGTVKIESLSSSDSSKHSSATKHPTNNVQNSPASAAGVDAEEPDRDVGQLLHFLSRQEPMINAMMKIKN